MPAKSYTANNAVLDSPNPSYIKCTPTDLGVRQGDRMRGQKRRSYGGRAIPYICLVTCLSAGSIASQNQSVPASVVRNVSDVLSNYSIDQRDVIPVLPPNSNHTLTQSGGLLLVENWSGFPRAFVSSLIPVERDGVIKYPIWVAEDATATPRKRFILNSADKVIASVAVPADYDPAWWVRETYAGVGPDEFRRLLPIFDGSRVIVRYELIDQKNHSKLVSASPEKKSTGTVQPMLLLLGGNGPFDELLFTAIDSATNTTTVTIGCPTNISAIDIFAVDGGAGLLDRWWTLLGSTNVSTNLVTWVDTATNAMEGIRFYAAGNAATNSVTDPDGDGIPWAREVFLYHSSPTNSDTDADGLSDYEEVVNLHTDPSNNDTNKPTGSINVPPTGFRWIFLP